MFFNLRIPWRFPPFSLGAWAQTPFQVRGQGGRSKPDINQPEEEESLMFGGCVPLPLSVTMVVSVALPPSRPILPRHFAKQKGGGKISFFLGRLPWRVLCSREEREGKDGEGRNKNQIPSKSSHVSFVQCYSAFFGWNGAWVNI